MFRIQKILVATDFSETSTEALQKSMELAQAFQARLQVCHVVEEPYGYVGPTHGMLPEIDAFRQTLVDAASSQLNHSLSPAAMERFHPELTLTVGIPYAEIVRLAKAGNADLIVIGTHGRGPMWHLLLGSVAEKVVRHAHCPVLTIRPSKNTQKTSNE